MTEFSSPYPILVIVLLAIALLASVLVARRMAISDQLRSWLVFVPRLIVLGALLVVLLNPVRISKDQLPPRPANVMYLVDCSRSMALDRPENRIDQVKRAIYEADLGLGTADRPRIHFYRFGQTLAAAPSAPQLQAVEQATRLRPALDQLPSRFSQDLPKAVVLFSDGAADSTADLPAVAAGYREMGVPVHAFPVGDEGIRGDVAIEQLVVPRRVEPGTKVPVRVTVASRGFDNERLLVQIRKAEQPDAPPLAKLPITLAEGSQPCELVVEVTDRMGQLVLEATPLDGEAVLQNNRVPFLLGTGDRKIRVLYMEGTAGNEYRWIQTALTEDPDIECLSMVVDQQYVARPRLMRVDDRYKGFPTTPQELFEFDVVICSDISQGAFTREQMQWTVDLVSQRGGGFVMIGGHTSFGSGNWDDTSWDKLIPVDMTGGTLGRGYFNQSFRVDVPQEAADHPIWRLLEDPQANRLALQKMPVFYGTNIIQRLKPAATLLGQSATALPNVGVMPVFACETYGRGRTFAMAPDSTAYWGQDFERYWGEGDNRYFRKFWRNVVRWLSENSIAGNKRVHIETDKLIYRPGEPIDVTAVAYDESFQETTAYRLSATLKFNDEASEGASAAAQELAPKTEQRRYQGEVETVLPPSAISSDREFSTLHPAQLEVVVFDESKEIARTRLDIQVLEDSKELLHPEANRKLLEELAERSGGRVLEDARDLAAVLSEYPSTPGEMVLHRSPIWDRSLFWCLLLSMLGIEWSLRRRLGFG